jgi:hypothetical protein
MLDGVRVPWVDEQRDPTPEELDFAIRATAVQMAMRRQETEERTTHSSGQEILIRERLELAGLNWVSPTDVLERLAASPNYDPALGIEARNLDLALERGEFTSEFLCAGTKCDVPIRIHDGRFFAIEGKVSNSASNSHKRLIREVVGKVSTWRAAFGQHTLVGGFIAGVYSLKNLNDAQAKGTLLFFQHEPEALERFVAADWVPRSAPQP